MIVPAIAKAAYEKLKNDDHFEAIFSGMYKFLRKLTGPIRRSRHVHVEVDKSIKKLFSNKVVSDHVTCRKGCAACCHTQVGITSDEAELLAQKVMKGHQIDIRKLKIQAEVGNDPGKWYKIPYSMRSCAFLTENNECSIYDDRPSVCRTNYVLSDPALCSTMDGTEKTVRLLSTHEADMMVVASFKAARSAGAMPVMLWEALEKMESKVESPKRSVFQEARRKNQEL